ncbi:MAG: GNAT family N-acetyltransferase [Anaerolineae bacterium]|nr:GNAT family N-acetyltransferase [Anaerolineae bacterium]
MPLDYALRRAEKIDHGLLYSLIDDEDCRQHRHLDWHSPIDWLGEQPFWLLLKNQRARAALACPADPPGIAWIRLFAITSQLRPLPTWNILFQKALEDYHENKKILFASVALQKWYADLLTEAGFTLYQYIVVLSWQNDAPPLRTLPPGLKIRRMETDDLETISFIDKNSFETLWQNSLNVITCSYKQSNYATVAELDGKIIGFQISSSSFESAHLARLAVLPEYQGQSIGSALVYNLLGHFYYDLGIRRITVNTQSSNHASLALYEKIGFKSTGEHFPVFTLENLPDGLQNDVKDSL